MSAPVVHGAPAGAAAEPADPGRDAQRGRRRLAALLVAVGLLVTGLGIGRLATPVGPPPDPPTAWLRIAHLSPDTPPLDVTATAVGDSDQFTIKHLGFAGKSPYRTVRAGAWRLDFRPAGFGPATPPVLSAVLQAQAGGVYTAADSGAQDGLHLLTIADVPGGAPAATARARLVNAGVRDPVDLRVPGVPSAQPPVDPGGTGGYIALPAGSIRGSVAARGRAWVALAGSLTAGCDYLEVVDGDVTPSATHLVEDRCGALAAASPSEEGEGVTAWPPALLSASALLLAGALALWRRARPAVLR